MNLVNKKVVHGAFGRGKVISQDEEYIEVEFKEDGVKKFLYPDAFRKYLKVEDAEISGEVQKKVEEQNLIDEQERLEREKAIRQTLQDVAAQQNRPQSRKDHPKVQSVFWCDEEEVEEIFTEWSIFVGTIKSGERKGEPRKLARMNGKSGCLLTTRGPDVPEEERRIHGVFMVDETFDGRTCEDGIIKAHGDYRLKLTDEESDKMLFWNYYLNERFPERTTWNSGRQRYFDNIWMAQILKDIVDLRKDSEGEDLEKAQNFLDYFCRINRINIDILPDPGGALIPKEEPEEEDKKEDKKEEEK